MARAESEVSDGVVAMSSVVQLRVCNASSKAKALVRTARRIGWKAGELRSATRASRWARSTAASINREMATRSLGRPDRPGRRFHAWRTPCLASRRFLFQPPFTGAEFRYTAGNPPGVGRFSIFGSRLGARVPNIFFSCEIVRRSFCSASGREMFRIRAFSAGG